jgi:hypothetical protein
MVAQTALLYLSASSSDVRNALYGCAFLCGMSSVSLVTWAAGAVSAIMFIIPSIIGALTRSWRSAIALVAIPWWVATLLHAGSLLAPHIGIGAGYASYGLPFWLDMNRLAPLLLSLALFCALAWLGYTLCMILTSADHSQER